MTEGAYHIPVMLDECLDHLINDTDGVYVDATLGGGGHTRALLKRLSGKARVFALDQDLDALGQAPTDPRLTLIHANFRHLQPWMRYYDIAKIDGVLADLGVSSFQLDERSKGFSFAGNEVLDMRMNRQAAIKATDVINNLTEDELVTMFSDYGQVRNAKTLAKAIVSARTQRPIERVQELLQCMDTLVIGNRARYLAQVFQAIRIKVNNEIGALSTLLFSAAALLKPGGKLVVLTYHSVEDRVVKHFMKSGKLPNLGHHDLKIVEPWHLRMETRKPIVAGQKEVSWNRRARSAKLRVAVKIETS